MSDKPQTCRSYPERKPQGDSDQTPAPAITLDTPIQFVKGVGPKRAERFLNLEIRTVRDLLRHWPHRYEVERAGRPIGQLVADQIISARGEIGAVRVVGRGRRARFEATLVDETGRLHLTWFNGGYLVNKLHAGMIICVQGKTKRYDGGYLQMVNPKWTQINEETPSSTNELEDRIRPVYPATEDLASETIDKVVRTLLETDILAQVTDHLPSEYRKKRELPACADAVRMIHAPQNESEVADARRRFVFDEFLLLQLAIAMKRRERRAGLHAPPLAWNATIDQHIRARFPFDLTKAQDSAIKEITGDLACCVPMNRLLQGDVGSGKTVVALYAMLMAVVEKAHQAALMAPTEILAEQHFFSISTMLKDADLRIELLTGRLTAKERNAIHQAVAHGKVDLVIGTHAILSERVKFRSLALVVIDEQHRFGVEQRAALRERAAAISNVAVGDSQKELFGERPSKREAVDDLTPHTLVMTATPIPRTMALTVFGDLDISTIDELPPGRSPVITKVVTDDRRDAVHEYVADRVRQGEQAYVVVPAIDESPGADLKYVKEHAAQLAAGPFAGLKIAEMHGRMKRDTRARIMHRFRQNEINILVATTVIEVGVDVPNATIIIVEHAERFGLSQLHQLRGRVGRSHQQSLCIFFAKATTDEAIKRLEAIRSTTNGFEIAERDFEIRGMGEIFGTRQSGASPFRIAQFPRDFALLRMARRDAQEWIERDPELSDQAHLLLRKRLMAEVGHHFGIGDVG